LTAELPAESAKGLVVLGGNPSKQLTMVLGNLTLIAKQAK
jgi:hypothetical protein